MEKVPEPRLSRPRVACDLCGLACRAWSIPPICKRCRRQHGGAQHQQQCQPVRVVFRADAVEEYRQRLALSLPLFSPAVRPITQVEVSDEDD